jgi:hypothetical protein
LAEAVEEARAMAREAKVIRLMRGNILSARSRGKTRVVDSLALPGGANMTSMALFLAVALQVGTDGERTPRFEEAARCLGETSP